MNQGKISTELRLEILFVFELKGASHMSVRKIWINFESQLEILPWRSKGQFSMSKIIWIIPFFIIEEYEIRSTTFIIETFCLISFLKHLIY